MNTTEQMYWTKVASVKDVPNDGGACVLFQGKQVAIFQFNSLNKWYATDNMCPHMKDMVLSRGMIGDIKGEPKVACPMHKKNFSLETGKCLSGDDYQISVYPIKIEGDAIFLGTEN